MQEENRSFKITDDDTTLKSILFKSGPQRYGLITNNKKNKRSIESSVSTKGY